MIGMDREQNNIPHFVLDIQLVGQKPHHPAIELGNQDGGLVPVPADGLDRVSLAGLPVGPDQRIDRATQYPLK